MSGLYKNKYRISSARLPGWDYRNSAGYFVTICTKNKEFYFGNISNDEMVLNDLGKVAQENWLNIPFHNPMVTLGEFITMPNHIHGVLILHKDSTETPERNLINDDGISKHEFLTRISPHAGSVSAIIRSYKSAVTKWANENNLSFAWQARFHDHIIRDDKEFNAISNYIILNPQTWEKDKFYTLK
jgi:putative transposase